MICSDASFPFETTPDKTPTGMLEVLKQQSDIMMARIKNLQFMDIIYGQHKDQINSAYFSINWTVDEIIMKSLKNYKISKKLGLTDLYTTYKKTFGQNDIETAHPDFISLRNRAISRLNFPEFRDYLKKEDVDEISRIGTRLFGLKDREINMLMKHGSTLCGVQCRVYLDVNN